MLVSIPTVVSVVNTPLSPMVDERQRVGRRPLDMYDP